MLKSVKVKMCMLRLSKTARPLYVNITHRNFSTTKDVRLEAVNMSYNLYENIQNPSGAFPLTIMHGLLGSKTNWNSLSKALHKKTFPQRSILSVDARNHGESPHSLNHSYEYLAEDVQVLLNNLGIKKSALLGHSMGGRAMMYFALKYPNLVDKLIVADISPISSSPTLNTMSNIFSLMESVTLPSNITAAAARAEVNKALSTSITDYGLRSFLVTNLKPNPDGSYAWRMNLEALRTNFVSYIARFPEVGNVKYDGPVLFLAGEKSDFLRETDYSKILKLFPNAEFKRILGAGHWLHSEKPAEFLDLALEFLNRKEL